MLAGLLFLKFLQLLPSKEGFIRTPLARDGWLKKNPSFQIDVQIVNKILPSRLLSSWLSNVEQ
jgi:hypothetical protein